MDNFDKIADGHYYHTKPVTKYGNSQAYFKG